MKLLIGLGFKLGFIPVIHVPAHPTFWQHLLKRVAGETTHNGFMQNKVPHRKNNETNNAPYWFAACFPAKYLKEMQIQFSKGKAKYF